MPRAVARLRRRVPRAMPADESPLHRSLVGQRSPLQWIDPAVVVLGLLASALVFGVPWREGLTAAAAVATASFLFLAERASLYRSWRGGGMTREGKELLGVWAGTVGVLLLVAFVTRTTGDVPRRLLLGWFLCVPAVLLALRVGVRGLARGLRHQGWDRKRAAIVGSNVVAERVAETMGSRPWMGFELVGCFGLDALDELERRAREGSVDTIYVATAMGEESRVAALVRRLAGTRAAVFFVPDLAPFALLRARWTHMGELPAVSLFENPLTDLERLSKRLEDLVFGGIALGLAGLPMLAIAAAIRLTSPGPVLFRQLRHGLDGEEILVRKFRTMYVCESDAEFRQARRGDPRVTPLGRFLRATSLDELPQLLDVLAGTMSLVGPRPHPIPLNEQHADSIDWFPLRHRMKPGITGWAQINGLRGETDTEEKMRGRVEHDLEYIRNWSLWLDLKILALTPFKGFLGTNAY